MTDIICWFWWWRGWRITFSLCLWFKPQESLVFQTMLHVPRFYLPNDDQMYWSVCFWGKPVQKGWISEYEPMVTPASLLKTSLTLICLFSSRSLWASICSLLHSSMIFFTSPSSRVELNDFGGSAEESDFSKLDDIILLDSMSCCKWVTGRQIIMQYVVCCCYRVSTLTLTNDLAPT